MLLWCKGSSDDSLVARQTHSAQLKEQKEGGLNIEGEQGGIMQEKEEEEEEEGGRV